MSRADIEALLARQEIAVFSRRARKVETGSGLGAPGNRNENHFRALERREGKAVADVARAAEAELRSVLR